MKDFHMKEKVIFFLIIPIVWMISSVCSYHYPGDEYFLYYAGSIVGTKILDSIGTVHLNNYLPFIGVLVSLPSILLITYILYKLRLNWKLILSLWLVVTVALCLSAILDFPSYAKAISKNGSLQAYIFAAINFALYWVLFFAILIKTVILLICKVKKQGNRSQSLTD